MEEYKEGVYYILNPDQTHCISTASLDEMKTNSRQLNYYFSTILGGIKNIQIPGKVHEVSFQKDEKLNISNIMSVEGTVQFTDESSN